MTKRRKYHIVRKLAKGSWSVYWDGKRVFHATGENAEVMSSAFCDGLERGITGSYQALGSHSRIRIEGWMDYLRGFADYEDYR